MIFGQEIMSFNLYNVQKMASQKKQETHNLAAILEEQITLRGNHQPPSGSCRKSGRLKLAQIFCVDPQTLRPGPGPMFCLAVFRGHLEGVPRLESEEFLHSREKKPNPQNTCPM